MVLAIIDPTASVRDGADHATEASPRLTSLAGLRVGLLENTKRNAADILEVIGSTLQGAASITALVPFTKQNFALPLPDDLLDRIEAECDAVIIGVGDCGSCSASAVADGIMLEARGIPTAVICTDAFEVTASAMAKLKGRPDYQYLRTSHPIANLTGEQISERGQHLADAVAARLTNNEAQSA